MGYAAVSEKDRALRIALILLIVGAVIAWPLACSDVGLVLTFVFAGLASVTTLGLLHARSVARTIFAVVAAGVVGMATIFAAAVVVSFVCSLGATLS